MGCPDCIKGYLGRVPVHEVLQINQEIRDAISSNMPKEELRKLVYGSGHAATLLEDGLKKVVSGVTSFEEILRIIDVAEDFGEGDEELRQALMGKTQITENKNDYEVL